MGQPERLESFDIIGGQERALTDVEKAFLEAVHPSKIDEFGLDAWLHEDGEGLWLIVSYDLVCDGILRRVLRVDFDGRSVCGGISPQSLNGDDGVRAITAGVDLTDEHGLGLVEGTPADLGKVVSSWFDREIDAFLNEIR